MILSPKCYSPNASLSAKANPLNFCPTWTLNFRHVFIRRDYNLCLYVPATPSCILTNYVSLIGRINEWILYPYLNKNPLSLQTSKISLVLPWMGCLQRLFLWQTVHVMNRKSWRSYWFFDLDWPLGFWISNVRWAFPLTIFRKAYTWASKMMTLPSETLNLLRQWYSRLDVAQLL